MTVIIGSDKDGYALKEKVVNHLKTLGYDVLDVSGKEQEDFIDVTHAVIQSVLSDEKHLGILFDGYGVGSFMAATKYKGMIAAEVSEERTAYMTREHNNARVITIGAKIVGEELANNIVTNFLTGQYAGGRHQIRVDMLNKMC